MRPFTILKNTLARRRALQRMQIRPEDLVLEVGSGQNPNPRADVLCDRYLLDHTERNRQPPVLDRPFAVGDIYHLPFRANAFDFVLCAHVLEHLEFPAEAAAELGRVARRGYVEVPSRENEILLPFPFHRWLIDREGDTLVFETKVNPIPDPGLRDWFRRLSVTVPDFPDLYLRRLHELGNVHGVVWEGSPSLRVEGPAGPVEAEASSPPRDEEIDGLRIALRRLAMHPWGRSLLDGLVYGGAGRRKVDLRSLVACPACGHEQLEEDGEAWTCGGCGRRYPLIRSGKAAVPFLVV